MDIVDDVENVRAKKIFNEKSNVRFENSKKKNKKPFFFHFFLIVLTEK